ncbi:MAG: 3-deoxy-D-manno-octulosonic acid transferase [Candidatus Omnitrophica bacterium]|nr:3-deoxy-D-manno-octulosonic acid transferase [Candidatus Omnitrophota bacterium]
MFIIYDFIILVVTLFYLPVYFFKRKFHSGFKMRFGFLPGGLELNRPIWIHAVSVGEAIAAKNLARGLRLLYPDKRFFISTVTQTGNKIAKSFATEKDFVAYFPLDLSFIVRSFVDKVNPSLFIVMETEIWPNLISYLYRKGTPVVLVNGRLSDRSFKGYRSIKFLLKPILSKIKLFCVQTPVDGERLTRLGVDKERIRVTGNMKFDGADYSDKRIIDSADKYRAILELGRDEKLWVCGSTHSGEEEIILDVYRSLLGEFPELKLLIAPRHPERAPEVGNIISKFGFCAAFVSGLPLKQCNCISKPVFVLDVIGELIYYYNIASFVFVGGSLVRKGGHNILEPASLGKPVITGPHMFNFRDIAGLFIENKAALLAYDKEELWANMRDLLRNPGKITELNERARSIILQNKGATSANLKFIETCIK